MTNSILPRLSARARPTRGVIPDWTISAAAFVVGGGVVYAVASGTGAPASAARAAILDALVRVPVEAAAWLIGVEHRRDRRQPVARVVRQLRTGEETAREAVTKLLGAFQGPPAPAPDDSRPRRPARPPKAPMRRRREPPAGAPPWLPPYLWAGWPPE